MSYEDEYGSYANAGGYEEIVTVMVPCMSFTYKAGLWPFRYKLERDFVLLDGIWYERYGEAVPVCFRMQQKLTAAYKETLAQAEKAKARYHG